MSTRTNMTAKVAVGIACILCIYTPLGFAQERGEGRKISWVNPTIPAGKGLQHKTLSSKALKHDVGYVVWTPPNFDASGSVHYPVVYFLHGAGGTETSDAEGFSSLLASGVASGAVPPAICVFPNGGMSGYRGDVESMIIDELVPLIDKSYPTQQEPALRVIAGFSMGGAGAVRLSLLHPELFHGAGSWGGGLSRRGSGADSPLLAAVKSNLAALHERNFAMLLVNGDQDRPDAYKPLAETLKPLGINHEVVVLEDTGHNLGLYYQKAGDSMIRFIGTRLKHGNLTPVALKSGRAKLDPTNSRIDFVGKHEGEKPDPRKGGFAKFSGTARATDGKLQSVEFEIETVSIWTEIEQLTNHLKGPDFFGVREFPKATFKSTSVTSSENVGQLLVTGQFKLLKTTREIRIPVTVEVSGNGLTLLGRFSIDRTQYGMTYGVGKVKKKADLTVSIGEPTR